MKSIKVCNNEYVMGFYVGMDKKKKEKWNEKKKFDM